MECSARVVRTTTAAVDAEDDDGVPGDVPGGLPGVPDAVHGVPGVHDCLPGGVLGVAGGVPVVRG